MRLAATPVMHLRKKSGAASALIILLLVLLIFFGILALVTAAADLRMAVRRAEWNQAYYASDSQAEQVLALIGQTCGEFALQTADKLLIDELAGLLDSDPAVLEQQVQLVDGLIRVDAKVAIDRQAEQGIEMTLLIDPGREFGTAPVIAITRWVWWRLPFDYDQHPGGVWEG